MTAGHHLLHTPISLGSAAAALSFDLASHLQPFGTAYPSYPYSLSFDHTHITSCQCHPIIMILEEMRLPRWGLARSYNLWRRIQEGNLTAVSASSHLISLVHKLLNLFPGFTTATVTLGYFWILEWKWLAEEAVFVTEVWRSRETCSTAGLFACWY